MRNFGCGLMVGVMACLLLGTFVIEKPTPRIYHVTTVEQLEYFHDI